MRIRKNLVLKSANSFSSLVKSNETIHVTDEVLAKKAGTQSVVFGLFEFVLEWEKAEES